MPVINIKEQKKALRARFKKLRETCPEDIRQKLDEKLCKSFLSLDEYKNCDALFTFVFFPEIEPRNNRNYMIETIIPRAS